MKARSKSISIAASRDKAEMLLKAALSKKATDPLLMRLAEFTTLTDYFLIVSARSARHVPAVADAAMSEARTHKFAKYSAEGITQGNWALLDYGDVIVHIFQPSVREFYDLEGLWSEAPREAFSPALTADIRAATAAAEEEDWE